MKNPTPQCFGKLPPHDHCRFSSRQWVVVAMTVSLADAAALCLWTLPLWAMTRSSGVCVHSATKAQARSFSVFVVSAAEGGVHYALAAYQWNAKVGDCLFGAIAVLITAVVF